jgi:hypothetical protein
MSGNPYARARLDKHPLVDSKIELATTLDFVN